MLRRDSPAVSHTNHGRAEVVDRKGNYPYGDAHIAVHEASDDEKKSAEKRTRRESEQHPAAHCRSWGEVIAIFRSSPLVRRGRLRTLAVVQRPLIRSRRRFGCQLARLKTHDAVVLGDHPSEFRWREPARVQPLQVFVGRPTGNGAALSDENGNPIVEELL